ncbi:MAG: alanine--glyoxylate aminotransferase family protein [Candidatus Omnitrophica bacterium]|nr:alanine--glyoxylate aminotransferase family protein [bacterium]MCC6732472.1 alanine--glyoxylate aminotransferase family protein [Candidatus Omnitrophota bacterium]MCL4734174.1 alanine--glyoxylate aminotransferase family protein [Candidatus Omnitrophota bacterium]
MTLPGPLHPSPRLLLGPGPSNVHPRVLQALSLPLLGHLDPEFLVIMDGVRSMLQEVLQTKNELTFPISGTGSAGMETCLVNLIEPGDEVVVCVAGVFGVRMCDIVERCGAHLIRVDAEWGHPIQPGQVREALKGRTPKLVAIVHAETSTGVLQPLEEISQLVHEAGSLFLVDAVTSLGGVEVRVDEWGIDALYSGTQKCLSAPPGLAPVTFSPRAVEIIGGRKSKVQSWYLDMTMVRKYWGAERFYHHTAPISMIYALYEALRLVLEEGLQNRFQRHRENHELLREGLSSLGFKFVVEPQYRLPELNAVCIPEGIEDLPSRRRLLNEFNIEIGGGLGAFAGKVWRIGLMGESCRKENVEALLSALKKVMG